LTPDDAGLGNARLAERNRVIATANPAR